MKSLFKKILSVLLVILLLIPGMYVNASGIEQFEDIDKNAWYYEFVKSAYLQGYMVGTNQTVFEPNSSLTRAMFVQILSKACDANIEAYGNQTNFSDVAIDSWYMAAVNWAYTNGIVVGTSEKTFSPKSNITRQEVAVILYSYVKANTIDTSLVEIVIPNQEFETYSDIDNVSNWALESIKWAVSAGLLKGYTDNTLKPKKEITRAEAAAIFRNYSSNILSNYSLTFYGKDIESKYPLVFNYDDEFVIIPLIETLKYIGAECTWESNDIVKVKYNNHTTILDTTNQTFCDEVSGANYFMTFGGGTMSQYHNRIGEEYFIDLSTAILYLMPVHRLRAPFSKFPIPSVHISSMD